ncbi:MAG TPA: hypothetical protein VKB78_08695, partial [Pirellulales bacterium]|nr:hypothetical protein [Pirellulales bacterium]
MMKLSLTLVPTVALCLASGQPASAQGMSAEQRKELLKKANDWSVPQPKPTAKIVKIWAYKSETKGWPMTDYYALGFVDPTDSNRALVGSENWDLTGKLKTTAVADIEKLSLNDIAVSSPFGEPNGTNFGLVTGIQLLRRGKEKIATALIDRSLAADSGHPRSMFFSPAGEPPVLMLARSWLAAAINEITSPKPDYARIK